MMWKKKTPVMSVYEKERRDGAREVQKRGKKYVCLA